MSDDSRDDDNETPKPIDDIAAFFSSMAAKAAEHAATCQASVCPRCDRFQCRACKATFGADSGSDEHCDACRTSAYRSAWTSRALSAIPMAFAPATLDQDWLLRLVGAPTITRARKSILAQRVAFTGPAGSGKTSLAIAMFQAAVHATAPAAPRSWRFGVFEGTFGAEHLYVDVFDLAKARWNTARGEAELVDRALRSPLVLIDELGGEDPRYASAVSEVIFKRHAAQLSTWITTGVGAPEIARRYGGGIARKALQEAVEFKLTGLT